MAKYKFNIGVYQADTPGADYKWNIGTAQTDELPPEEGLKKMVQIM